MNSTQLPYFSLSAYVDTGRFKSLCFLTVLLLYVCIVGANLLLIVVICLNRSLHEPMYLFLCSLCVNELYGSSVLFPFILVQILSDVHIVPAPLCFLQIFCIHSYVVVEFFNLAVMSYDRYLSICWPLQYNRRMTRRRIAALLAVTWLYSSVLCVAPLSLSAPLQLCGSVIHKVYCDNYPIVKLACSDTSVNNIYGLISVCLTIGCPAALILFTYMSILKVCFFGSSQTRQKALSTCSPHLASLVNFCCGTFFEVFQSRVNMSHLPSMLRIFLSLYWLTCPPLFNPLMYGLKLSNVRVLCKNLIQQCVNPGRVQPAPPER